MSYIVPIGCLILFTWFFLPFFYPSYWWKKRIYIEAWRSARYKIKQEKKRLNVEYHREQLRLYESTNLTN